MTGLFLLLLMSGFFKVNWLEPTTGCATGQLIDILIDLAKLFVGGIIRIDRGPEVITQSLHIIIINTNMFIQCPNFL